MFESFGQNPLSFKCGTTFYNIQITFSEKWNQAKLCYVFHKCNCQICDTTYIGKTP